MEKHQQVTNGEFRVITRNLEEILQEIVANDQEGMKSITYSRLSAVLIEGGGNL